jgi:salicylate hydroxylase
MLALKGTAGMAAPVTIIGAGMAGLTLGLALARNGIEPIVLEQSPVLGEIGAGLTISPNASRVLDHLGVGDGLEAIGYTPDRQHVRHYRTGRILAERVRGQSPRAEYGAGYFHVHRADLHALLSVALEAACPGAIRTGRKLTGARQVSGGVELAFADGSTAHADAVVGADGVRSVLRDALFETLPARFTGHVAWRGLVPVERLDPDVAAAPPGIHIGPGQMFLRYPLRGGSLINYAAFARQDGWLDEGWSARASLADPLAVFGDWDRLASSVIAATPPDGVFKWALFGRAPLKTWVAGRATLVGDAAHAMLPFMGQGAASSLEDAMVLARCLLAESNVEAAFSLYEATRRSRADFIQATSRVVGERLEGSNPEAYSPATHRNEDSLGLFAYDAVRTPLGVPWDIPAEAA